MGPPAGQRIQQPLHPLPVADALPATRVLKVGLVLELGAAWGSGRVEG